MGRYRQVISTAKWLELLINVSHCVRKEAFLITVMPKSDDYHSLACL